MVPTSRPVVDEKIRRRSRSESAREHCEMTTESVQASSRKRKMFGSEKKGSASQQLVIMDGESNFMSCTSAAKKRNCRRQLRSALLEEKDQENTAHFSENKLSLTVSGGADVDQMEEIQQTLFERMFGNVFPICFEAVGGELCIFSGTQEAADRITMKFKIMKKLAILVGCGLDCHFRMINNRYLLMMLVRGAPMVVFGATVTVIPDMSNVRLHGSPPDFLEDGQRKFFESILQLLPSRLESGKEALLADLNNGEESDRVQKFYEFLKPIRTSVFAYISSIHFAWYISDNANTVPEKFTEAIRKSMQMCCDNELVMQEQKKPGYADAWQSEWGIVPPINLNGLIDDIINTL